MVRSYFVVPLRIIFFDPKGGKITQGTGFYYPATVLGGITPDNCVFNEEIFGPVAMVLKAKDDKEAVNIHNKSIFGLGGGVFTKDEKKGEQIARQLDCGLAFVNR
jgi:succinate-semialdehyde dehydrogenase/glutarate-semialdehyde dehydrogenase